MNKQLLILPDSKKFTAAQTQELRAAGFVVVHLPDPAAARLISSETLPFTSNQALHIALTAVRRVDDYTGYRTLLDGLIALSKPETLSPSGEEA